MVHEFKTSLTLSRSSAVADSPFLFFYHEAYQAAFYMFIIAGLSDGMMAGLRVSSSLKPLWATSSTLSPINY